MVRGSEGLRPEIKTSRDIIISRSRLLEDNHSKLADRLREEYKENKRAGRLRVLKACSDARFRCPDPTKYVTIKSIAGGGEIENAITSNAGVESGVVGSHFDGEIFVPGHMPTGCGGLGAKDDEMKKSKPVPIKGAGYYISKNVEHPDPLIQALITANKMTKIMGKPNIAVAQNHRNAEVFPVGVFLPGQPPITAVNLIDLFTKYDPEKIYEKGIPELERRLMPNMFQPFLDACGAQEKELLLAYPNYKQMMAVQNPRLVLLSTEIMSAKIRYPEICDFPGIVFKIHLSRKKIGNDVTIDPEELQKVINQADYPIPHAVEGVKEPNKGFSDTDLVLIETDKLSLSEEVASRLFKEERMREWISLPERCNQVLIAQTQDGITQIIEEFRP